MLLQDINKQIGFWKTFVFIALTRGEIWPREYKWKCGCSGISYDGVEVDMVYCDDHMGCDVQDGIFGDCRQALIDIFSRNKRR